MPHLLGPISDRVLALVTNRLTRPASEHGLAEWLTTFFACDSRGRRFAPAYRSEQERKPPAAPAFACKPSSCSAGTALSTPPAAQGRHRGTPLRSLPHPLPAQLRPRVLRPDQHVLPRCRPPATGPQRPLARPAAAQPADPRRRDHGRRPAALPHRLCGQSAGLHHRRGGRRRRGASASAWGASCWWATGDAVGGERAGAGAGRDGLSDGAAGAAEPAHGSGPAARRAAQGPVGALHGREREAQGRRHAGQEVTQKDEVAGKDSGTRRFLVYSPERQQHERKLRRKQQDKVRARFERLQERVAGGEFERAEERERKQLKQAASGGSRGRRRRGSATWRAAFWRATTATATTTGAERRAEPGVLGERELRAGEAAGGALAAGDERAGADAGGGGARLQGPVAGRAGVPQHEGCAGPEAGVAPGGGSGASARAGGFLALVFDRILQRKLDQAGVELSSQRAWQALEAVQLVEFELDKERVKSGVCVNGDANSEARKVLRAWARLCRPPKPHPQGADHPLKGKR